MSRVKAMSAVERIESLLDAGSFIEIGASVHARNTDFNMPEKQTPADGVITGYGTIDSNLVYVFSQDPSVMGGAIGEMHARKIEKIYELALKMGAPVIGMYDCAGLRLQEATDALDALGRLYRQQTAASGVIPQYAAVFGQCGGGTALLAALSDFTFMVKDTSALFVNAPNTLDDSCGAAERYAGAEFQGRETGNADFVCENEETLLAQLDTGLDQKLLAEIADYFRPIQEEALKSGLLNPKVLGVNIKTLMYQVPGGMLSNLVSQLKDAHAEDKYYDVLEEIPRVRKDFGEPPLVTPSSQIVGTQAVLNVLMGERYKMITKESKALLHGEYGQTVKPFNPEVQKKACGDETPITCRPADLLKPELREMEKEVARYKQQDEDVLSYALFPQVAVDFFKYREAQQEKVDPTRADTKAGAYPV